ncbi:GGDEF and EAL domain-containing protein [Luteimonas sp. FCS-9]|uniref:bifunctional diguanylate cyclase/phosphodiesterase n=1 Tax=Luteimonas sp. FCS-9 TaxID=1547516 RepID=UPI00063E74CA|nr:GGDEF and EAL domain-containing protein [Luteimonas sp. FCS-9]KLJ02883.1 membrane protein [Luteimonas sp. FCS-9]
MSAAVAADDAEAPLRAVIATAPAGMTVAVAWTCRLLGAGTAALDGASAALVAAARACAQLDADADADVDADADADADAAMASTPGRQMRSLLHEDCRIAIAVDGPPGDGAVAEAWLPVALQGAAMSLALVRTERRLESMRRAERLQQALYEIAELASSALDMDEVLARIHAVVGRLTTAENFYIVLYDDLRETLRFLYFVDERDPWRADPEQELCIAHMPNSLTTVLLREGRPMLGPSTTLRALHGVDNTDALHGPDSADWLGVPLRRDGRVCGAIVVQSYDRPDRYCDEDRALLEFVAQHILTALDRKRAHAELERRVASRTQQLQAANRGLQAQIAGRERAGTLQRALYRISELSAAPGSLERFYADLHAIVGELLYARNFYIAMLSADGGRLEFPYSVDERDAVRRTRARADGLTEYVIATGAPLLAMRDDIVALESSGELRSHGTQAQCWLGVPLGRDGRTVGVIAVQSYDPGITFSASDQALLTFVAHHIDGAMDRKRAQDALKAAHTDLEFRVEARTRELESANRELRAQIGERVRAQQRLVHQARHDPLTGLPNRVQLRERLDAALSPLRDGGRTPFAVLFLDLDRFKLVNDSVGHAAGDAMLVEIAQRIAALLGPDDMAARLGGDEFAIMLGGVDDPEVADRKAAALLAALARPMWVAGRELFPSASIGIAMSHPAYVDGDGVLRDADAAMYRAKACGRDRSERFDEAMRAEATRLLDLEADLRRAILQDAFEPHFQPIVRLADGAVVGHEALLRWRHEVHGLLSPAEFIGVGEDSGLIEQVDWLMYRQVFRRMAGDAASGYVSINVSPRHFRSDDFVDRLLRLVGEAGADPRRLRIEITEVALLDDAPRALRMLNELRAHGVLALLDDFGTGFSALSYLHRFPIQALKIDQSFVLGLGGEMHAESLALVRAILALAATLGIDTIAEGIETVQQRRLLDDLGCQYGQGFLYGRPAAACVATVD